MKNQPDLKTDTLEISQQAPFCRVKLLYFNGSIDSCGIYICILCIHFNKYTYLSHILILLRVLKPLVSWDYNRENNHGTQQFMFF